ncbi:MAG: hypothetical protein WBK91_01965 [Alphaproteobacteria bacterium]
MRTKRILQSFATAALSVTAFAHCAHNPKGIGSFFVGDAPKAFVYSAQQEKEDNHYPWLVCLPTNNRVMKVTKILPPGPQLDAMMKEFPDSKVVATLPEWEILILGRLEGGPSHEILEQVLRITTSENRKNLMSCIGEYEQHLLDYKYYKLNPLPTWPMSPTREQLTQARPKSGSNISSAGHLQG